MAVWASPPLAQKSDTPDIVEAAKETVRAELTKRNLPSEEFSLEIIGEIVRMPEHDQFHQPVAVQLSPEQLARLQGSVHLASGKTPFRAKIQLLGTSQSDAQNIRGVDVWGGFVYEGLAPGRYLLRATGEGFKTTEIWINHPQDTEAPIGIMLEEGDGTEIVQQDAQPLSPDSKAVAEFPHTIITLAASRNGQIEHMFQVAFLNEAHFVRGATPPGWETLPITIAEYQKKQKLIDDFFNVLLNIEQPPERLLPYISTAAAPKNGFNLFPSDCPQPLADATVTDAQAKFATAYWLDTMFLFALALTEGYSQAEYFTLSNSTSTESKVCTFSAVIDAFNKHREDILVFLNRVGTLNPEHIDHLKPYLKSLNGSTLLIKENNLNSHIPNLPPPSIFCVAGIMEMHFVEVEGQLKLVWFKTDD
jgi:hypothetical protein